MGVIFEIMNCPVIRKIYRIFVMFYLRFMQDVGTALRTLRIAKMEPARRSEKDWLQPTTFLLGMS